MSGKNIILGIDTGGTYTDAAVIDAGQHRILSSAKAITTKGDLAVGVGGRILDDGGRVVASVGAPVIEETPAAEGEEPVEPEVVGKKDKEEGASAEGKPESKSEGKPEGKSK